jgi:predicted GNAT superfamily acetyltransferase
MQMIRALTNDDLPAVLALNNAHAVEVNAPGPRPRLRTRHAPQ